MKRDIVDVCLNNNRTLNNRFPEECGQRLFVFCENGEMEYKGVDIRQA